jgi:DNA-binding transcriptional regulator of glucitol operon
VQELKIGREDFLKIIATSGLILTVICMALVFQQLYRFKREFQSLDDDQVITDELAKKFTRRLYRLIGLLILMTVLSIVAIILPYQ